MKEIQYNRKKTREYAEKWAYRRNPKYYNFDMVGGDCTSFVSQCIFAGANVMNYSKSNGWYYNSGNNKSPSWSGVEFLYKFLTQNKTVGPYGKEVEKENVEIGDVIQLSNNGHTFTHSLIVVKKQDKIYIAAHTFDAFERDISSYEYKKIRFIKIEGVRAWN